MKEWYYDTIVNEVPVLGEVGNADDIVTTPSKKNPSKEKISFKSSPEKQSGKFLSYEF